MQDAGPFYRRQVERCSELGIDAGALPVSHLAVRTRTWREYLVLRDEFEERSVANLENVWNGRPISKLLLADPLPFSESASVELVELIPPFHQRVHRMGLIACQYRAAEWRHKEIELAAHELLQHLDNTRA